MVAAVASSVYWADTVAASARRQRRATGTCIVGT